MTADVELLPLHLLEAFSAALKGERGELDAWLGVNDENDVRLHVEAYARSAKDAEIKALRAEVDSVSAEAFEWRYKFTSEKARAERLAEALRFARTRFAPYMDDTDRAAFDAAIHPTAAQENDDA